MYDDRERAVVRGLSGGPDAERQIAVLAIARREMLVEATERPQRAVGTRIAQPEM